MTNSKGDVVNTYAYDPFGVLLEKRETQQNDLLFAGKWGVRSLPYLEGVYSMRHRIYFTHYGRFGAIDPYEFGGGYTNFYCYVGNNPINGKKNKVFLLGSVFFRSFCLLDVTCIIFMYYYL